MIFTMDFGYLPDSFPEHENSFYEMHFFTRGEGYFDLEDRRIPIGPNLMVLAEPDQTHCLNVTSPLIFYMIQISPDKEYQQILSQLARKSRNGLKLPESAGFSLEQIQNLKNRKTDESLNAAKHRLLALLYELLSPETENRVQQNPRMVQTVIQFMRNRIQERITLDALAEIVNLNKHYFSRLFKNQTGISPIEYFLKLKMEAAQYLLKETGLSNKDITSYLAFSDEYYFSKFFKKKTGQTPSEYRQKN